MPSKWPRAVLLTFLLPGLAAAQAFNLDFGEPDHKPPDGYAAAGHAGFWNAFPADHGSTTSDLIAVDGSVTTVSVRQLGGLDTVHTDDPTTAGADAALLDDFLVTFREDLETCLFFEHLEPGPYEVLIYAWMPGDPTVESYTDVDQEPGNPHSRVGGSWTGEHELSITYSRHLVDVAADGILNLHAGIAPDGVAALGAALNGVQIWPAGSLFHSGFESGDTEDWSPTGG